jgi:hypothetical protein
MHFGGGGAYVVKMQFIKEFVSRGCPARVERMQGLFEDVRGREGGTVEVEDLFEEWTVFSFLSEGFM